MISHLHYGQHRSPSVGGACRLSNARAARLVLVAATEFP